MCKFIQMNTLFLQAVTSDGDNAILAYHIEKMKHLDAGDWIFYSLIAIFCFAFVSLIVWIIYDCIDSLKYEWYETSGVIIDKHYKPEHHSTGIGVMANGAGGLSPVVTSNTESEDWFVMVKLDSGKVVKVSDLTPEYYYDVKIGTKVDVACKIYWLSKTRSQFDIIVD